MKSQKAFFLLLLLSKRNTIFFNWGIVVLQCCVSFYCTRKLLRSTIDGHGERKFRTDGLVKNVSSSAHSNQGALCPHLGERLVRALLWEEVAGPICQVHGHQDSSFNQMRKGQAWNNSRKALGSPKKRVTQLWGGRQKVTVNYEEKF